MLPFPLFLTFKHLRPKRSISSIIPFITIAGISLGVSILMVVLAVMTGFGDVWREKILSFKPHLTVYSRTGIIPDPDALSERIRSEPDVVSVAQTISSPVMLRSEYSTEPVVAILIGIDKKGTDNYPGIRDSIFAGSFNVEEDNAVAGANMAMRLDPKLGDTFLCYSPLSLKSADQLYFPEELRLSGIFRLGMRDIDDGVIFTSLGMARDVTGLERGCQTIQIQVCQPDNLASVANLANTLTQKLGSPYYVNTWHDEDKVLFDALATEKTMMMILLAFIAVVAAFCVTNTLIIITVSRTAEIGLLKALGFSPARIMLAFILNGQIQCLSGIFLGLALGWLILCNLPGIVEFLADHGHDLFPESIYGLAEIPYRIIPSDVVTISILVFIFCLLASLIPSWRAASLDPIKAINQE